jgi:hypothetical protein
MTPVTQTPPKHGIQDKGRPKMNWYIILTAFRIRSPIKPDATPQPRTKRRVSTSRSLPVYDATTNVIISNVDLAHSELGIRYSWPWTAISRFSCCLMLPAHHLPRSQLIRREIPYGNASRIINLDLDVRLVSGGKLRFVFRESLLRCGVAARRTDIECSATRHHLLV